MTNEQPVKTSFFSKPWAQSIVAIVVIFGALATFIFWQSSKNTVYIEDSHLEAPIVNMSVTAPGVLNAIYVKQGDRVVKDQALMLVGSETVVAKEDGVVSSIPEAAGGYYAPGQVIASLVVDSRMQAIASIEENKGLDRIASGQRVTFTVDTFEGKQYQGIVDRVSPISADTGALFSISDKRPIKRFNVYVNFDSSKYPELKSGMSAKVRITTKL